MFVLRPPYKCEPDFTVHCQCCVMLSCLAFYLLRWLLYNAYIALDRDASCYTNGVTRIGVISLFFKFKWPKFKLFSASPIR